MPKYINVETLKAAVSAYCDKQRAHPLSRMEDVLIHDVLDIIDAAPAADVVEVVRCRDCCMHDNCYTEEVFEFAGMTDGFCCIGKRDKE